MADKSIFEQDFDSLLNSVGVQIDNQTETTNAPTEDVEPEQVKEAADKAETVAQKEAKKEKTTEDYRVDLDVLGGVVEDETPKPVAPDETPNVATDVWGDPLSTLSNESTPEPSNRPKTVDNTKSTKSSVWGGPSDKTNQQPKSDKGLVWGTPATSNQSASGTSSVWGEPKAEEPKAEKPKAEKPKAEKPKAEKVSGGSVASKQAEQQTSFDLSIKLPEAIVALLGGEKDTIFSDIEAKAKAFILQEMKSAAKNAVDKQFLD